MRQTNEFHVQLRCPICGSTDIEIAEDESSGKCNLCNKEFPGGIEELKGLNQDLIQKEIEARDEEITRICAKEL